MKNFFYKDHAIKYLETGAGRPIIFLHNAGNDHTIWEHQIRHFQRSHKIYALDQLGYGESDRPHVDYTLDLYANVLNAFITGLEIHKPILIGNCLGSAMSIQYALKNPDKVQSMVLFNVLTKNTSDKGFFGPICKAVQGSRLASRCLTRLQYSRITSWIAVKGCHFFLYGTKGEQDRNFVEHVQSLYAHPDQLRVFFNLIENQKSFQGLDEIQKPHDFPPACVVWGEKNRILPLSAGREFCGTFNPERLDIIRDCGHLVMRENYNRANESIEEFIGVS